MDGFTLAVGMQAGSGLSGGNVEVKSLSPGMTLPGLSHLSHQVWVLAVRSPAAHILGQCEKMGQSWYQQEIRHLPSNSF